MRSLQFLTTILFITFDVSAQGLFPEILNSILPGFKSKSAESTIAALVELGIGNRANDNSKIVNVTDSNWEDHWGPHNTGEWLVEFTAEPEHCASCELIDLAFNVYRYLTSS
jgi:hypothetical protein